VRTPTSKTARTIIRPRRLAHKLDVGIATVWRLARKPDFPQKVHLTSHASGWFEDEIDSWLATRRAPRV
jgi:prophage regulatory protein